MKCGNSVEYWTLHLNWSYLEINEKNVFIYLELELAKERCKYVLLRMWIYYEKRTVYAYPHWYKKSQKWALFLLAPLRLYEPTLFVGELWSNKPESRPYQSWEKNEHPNDCISGEYACISYGTLIKTREAFIPNLAQAEPLKPRPGWAMS